MKLNLKFFASLQFWLGLALAAGAVVGFLLLGQALNPAPLRIVVAAQDIQRGDILTQEVLMVSRQQLSASLASHYLQEHDLPLALGAVAVDNIYRGDPVAKVRLAAGQEVETARRLSAALEDPEKVIRVLPVTPDNCPQGVYPGDIVEVGFSLSGQAPGQIGAQDAPVTQAYRPFVGAGDPALDLPASKVILRDVLVLRVEHEQVPNPNYGAGLGTGGGAEPAFLEGEVERLVIVVDASEGELLDFALHNGRISVGLRSYRVREEMEAGAEQSPTLGFTWTDFSEWFLAQRIRAETHLSATVPLSATLGVTPTAEADTAEVVTARNLDWAGNPIEPTDTFGPDDAFYFVAYLTVAQGTTVEVRWTYGTEAIQSYAFTAEEEEAVVRGYLPNEGPWPAGEYGVAVYDGTGKMLAAARFRVREE